MSVAGNPTNNDEIEAKKASDALSPSVDNVVLPTSDPTQLSRFIMRSKGYFDLQAYVLSGKEFPTSYSAFDAQISKSTFRKLSEIDSEIYSKTRDTMVAVGSTCQDYHHNYLAELVTAGQAAIAYSDYTIKGLETADFGNLRYNLEIIMDEKYTSSDKFDDAYTTAREEAMATLSTLRDDAKDRQNGTDQITQTLIGFKENTLKNQPNVKFLIKQYQTGPVENNSDEKTPYLAYLNKDLADGVANFNKMLQDAKEAGIDWEENTAMKITGWIPIVGGIVTVIHGAKVAGLRAAHKDLQSQISQLKQDRKEEADLAAFVMQSLIQYTEINQRMTNAITAISELSLLFSNQSNCYDAIAVSLDRMRTSTDLGALRSRKQFIQYQIKICTNKLKELKVVAEEFTRSIMTQVEL